MLLEPDVDACIAFDLLTLLITGVVWVFWQLVITSVNVAIGNIALVILRIV